MGKPRILVLGATGMLGSTLFRAFSADENFETFGTMRDPKGMEWFPAPSRDHLVTRVQAEEEAGLVKAFSAVQPDIVFNCIGIIKQLPSAKDHLESLSINAMLPHRIASYAAMTGARLVHFSTDCVFSGQDGMYTEDALPDARDLYGRSKLLGEVDYENAVTLRTSIIGHEISSAHSLIDWFLAQQGRTRGFRKAVFSGLPTIEVARVLREFVIPNPQLRGLYHLSVEPINKYDLLTLVGEAYGKDIVIEPDDELVIDRSLNSDRFREATGFTPRPWPDLIRDMHSFHESRPAV